MGQGLSAGSGGVLAVEISARIFIYGWAVLGLFLVLYCLMRYIKRYSYWVLAGLILFGGMDCVISVIKNLALPIDDAGLEFYASYFQYSSNTTLIYWVFNQTIAPWMIVAFLLLLKSNKRMAGWASFTFAYGPFPTFGMIPITIAAMLDIKGENLREKIKSAISAENIMGVFMILLVYGEFYCINRGTGLTNNTGFAFALHSEFRTVTLYILFLLAEVWIYYIAMGRQGSKFRLFWVVLAELSLLPLYSMGTYNEWTMRGSIPALFILMIICLQYILDEKINIKNRRIMMVLLVLGFMTSAVDIRKHVTQTLTTSQSEYLNDPVYSLSNIKIEDEQVINTIINTYWVYEDAYEDSFLAKYLLRR